MIAPICIGDYLWGRGAPAGPGDETESLLLPAPSESVSSGLWSGLEDLVITSTAHRRSQSLNSGQERRQQAAERLRLCRLLSLLELAEERHKLEESELKAAGQRWRAAVAAVESKIASGKYRDY